MVRERLREGTDNDSKRMCAAVSELNDMLRSDVVQRMQTLSAQAVAAMGPIAMHWEARESYRMESLLKASAFKAKLDKQAADLVSLAAAAELAINTDIKEKKNHKAKITSPTPSSKRQSLS